MEVKKLIKQIKARNKVSNAYMFISVVSGMITTFIVISLISQLSSERLTFIELFTGGGVIVVCQCVKAIFYAWGIWKAHNSAYKLLAEIRLELIDKMKKLPLGFFQQRKTGELVGIINHDVEQIEKYLAHTQPEIMITLFVPAVVFIAMFIIDWRLAIVMALPIPAMVLWQKFINKIWGEKIKYYSQSTRDMTADLIEYISVIPVIKAFSTDEKKTDAVLARMSEYITWVKKATLSISLPMSIIKMFLEMGLVLVSCVGLQLIITGEIKFVELILAIALTSMFSDSFIKYISFHHTDILLTRSAESIQSILGENTMKQGIYQNNITTGKINFHNITFGYKAKEYILDNLNLCFEMNSRNAIVGTSGSGKTTIAHLIMRFWEPTKGYITINGVNISDIDEKKLSTLVSIVQQELFLFDTSIEENIRIGNSNATHEEIVNAARMARIHDTIVSLPNGYDTYVGESGIKLSGGEKQRVSIARLILKNAPIVILDEATAAIDPYNESLIQEAINNLSIGKTLIVIAHHLKAIKDFDQIIILDKGQVIGCGKHEDLLESCIEYQKMVEIQEKVDDWMIKKEVSS